MRKTQRTGTVYFRFRSEPADAGKRLDLDDSFPGATGDTLYQHEFLYQLYLHADPHYSGRVTVPVLWTKEPHHRQQRISRNHPHVQTPRLMRWTQKRVITTHQPCKRKLTN